MRNIVHLARIDLRMATSSTIAMIVLFGVAILPSFFGWFNVLSSWDPFGNVKNLSVAVANADEGYQSDLFPLKVNVGEQVLSSLRANTDLNWVFTTKKEAIEGTRSEKYYAALVLPPTFSRSMLTFLAPDAKPAQIEYYSNEKANALSPEITGEAATDVSTQVNQSFTKTLDAVGLSIVSALADQLDSAGTQAGIVRLESGVEQLATRLRAGATTAQMFAELIESSKPLVRSAASLAGSAADLLQDASGPVQKGTDAADGLKSASANAANVLTAALATASDQFADLSRRIDALFASLDSDAQAVAAPLKTIANEVDSQISDYQSFRDSLQALSDGTTDPVLKDSLEAVISQLDGAIANQQALRDGIDNAATAIASGAEKSQANRAEILSLVAGASSALQNAEQAYTTDLKPKLEQLSASLSSIDSNVASIADDLGEATSALSDGAGSLTAALDQNQALFVAMTSSLARSADGFDALAAGLKHAGETGDLSDVKKIIQANPALLAGELTTPVGLDRVPVFKVDSFGAQMAPFYTVLGLWVGALLLSVLIAVTPAREVLPPGEQFTPTQEYFGRYGLFALLGFVQSSVLYLGLIGFVGVRPAHPFLLILAGWVMSLVFTLITYTLVLSFGEAGKALGVVLLVVQISAGGGAYPLTLLPTWFQSISPFLPVTHATNAVRSAIAGIYNSDYWVSLGCLALFIVPALLLGLLLRRPLIAMNNDLAQALEATKLM